MLTVTDPLGGINSQSYDSIGRVADTSDENNNVTTFGYDANNRLTLVTDPLFNNWGFSYDVEGVIASATDPLGNTTSFTSDNRGRITEITSPLDNTINVSYDAMGLVLSVTDPLDNVTTFTRDPRGLLLTASLQDNTISVSYIRNAIGQITDIIDPNGNSWSRSFDTMGRRVSSTDPLANLQTVSYDNRNRQATIAFPDSLGSLTLGYDFAGNLTSSNFSDSTSFSYSYDENNRLTNADGITLEYDANNRIINSNGIDIVRDAGGRITSMTLATDKTVTFDYDANGRVTDVNDWAGGVTSLSYDSAGKVTNMIRPNGVQATRSYDNDSQVISLSEGLLATINLTRDAKGQITNAIRNLPLSASSANIANSTITVDAASQIASASYDAMGRLVNDGSNSYTWNLATQLTSITNNNGDTAATYDATGSRLSKTIGTNPTTGYIWNYALSLPSISIEQQGGIDSRYYIHTPDGALLYSIDAVTDARHFYHYDEMGNTLFVTNDNGDVVASYAYSPFGRLIAETGNLDNPFSWQGQFGIMSEGDDLYYIRARYYDARTGRFISRDPISSIQPVEINPYQYAGNNPLLFVDLDGLQREERLQAEDYQRSRSLVAGTVVSQSLDSLRALRIGTIIENAAIDSDINSWSISRYNIESKRSYSNAIVLSEVFLGDNLRTLQESQSADDDFNQFEQDFPTAPVDIRPRRLERRLGILLDEMLTRELNRRMPGEFDELPGQLRWSIPDFTVPVLLDEIDPSTLRESGNFLDPDEIKSVIPDLQECIVLC